MKKYYCDLKIGSTYKRCNAWEIINIKEDNPKEFYKNIKENIYSTHGNHENKRRMYVKKYKDKSFFSYFPNTINTIPREYLNETLTHSIYKDLISKLKVLNLKSMDETISLKVKASRIEHRVVIENYTFYTDVYFTLEENDLYLNELYFEILFSHKVDNIKNTLYKNKGYLIFEFEVPSRLSFEELNNDEEITTLIKYLETSLTEYIPGVFTNL